MIEAAMLRPRGFGARPSTGRAAIVRVGAAWID
jgi:hypothetical protein